MATLYPLKFKPIVKERVWGGDQLIKLLGKPYSGNNPVGESWELSGLHGDTSVIKNGFLKKNDINEIVETYLGDITGDAIYDRFGMDFPKLIKYLDFQKGFPYRYI
jgi:mannose-6-phosphate isomerase